MIPKMHFNQNADDGDRGHEEEMCNPLLIRLNGDLSGTTCPTHDDSVAPHTQPVTNTVEYSELTLYLCLR